MTAHSFADAFNRVAQPKLESPATAYMREIVGAAAVIDGKAQSISGVRVLGRYRLQIRLTRPLGDFTARLTMPFFCPILPNTPIDPERIDNPAGSGPYYVAERIVNQRIVLRRNPFYRGDRPANVDQVVWTVGEPRGLPERGRGGPDRLLPGRAASRPRRTGGWPRSTGSTGRAASSSSAPAFDWFSPSTTTGRRSEGPGQIPLKKAINYAIDRPAMARAFGYLAGKRTDQMLPPALARAASIYPLGGADPATARKWLARATVQAAGARLLRQQQRAGGIAIAQVLVFNLKQIGIDVEVKYFDTVTLTEKSAHPGRAVRHAMHGWSADYADPAAFFVPLLGRRAGSGQRTSHDPRVTRAIEAANRLTRRRRAEGVGRPRRRPDARQPALGADRRTHQSRTLRLAELRLRPRPPGLRLRHRGRVQEVDGRRLSLTLAMLAAGAALLVAPRRAGAHRRGAEGRRRCDEPAL